MRRLAVTVAVVFALDLPARDAVERRGGVAFHYATAVTPAELAWLSRFEVVVTHDPLPGQVVDALHAAGTRVVLYEWSVAFYASKATPWQKRLAPRALLNAVPLRGHVGAEDADAFYYDPASAAHERERARATASRLKSIRYDGVFFDTTTAESVHPAAMEEYRRRHGELAYDAAFARFLKALRRELGPRGVIVTNQGYRAAEHWLPYADWEVTESLITWPRNGRFVFRPWRDDGDLWNSTEFLMEKLIAPVQRAYPRVRFVHLNYLDAPDAETIAAVVATAKLFDAEAFVATPSIRLVPSELYFADLEKPAVRLLDDDSVVAVNRSARPLRVAVRGTYEDVVTGERMRGPLSIAPGRAVVARRVPQ